MKTALLVLTTWSLLAAGASLRGRLGLPGAQAVTFGLATLLVWGVCIAESGLAPVSPRRVTGMLATALSGTALGYAAQPAFVALTLRIGWILGLGPDSVTPPACRDPLALLGSIVLAPLFEEPLYRGRVLEAVRQRWGAGVATGVSSATFALPHLHPWPVLAGFWVGIALACVVQRTGSLLLCVGLHAGLNLASAWEGIAPSPSLATPRGCIACGAVALIALACLSRRRT